MTTHTYGYAQDTRLPYDWQIVGFEARRDGSSGPLFYRSCAVRRPDGRYEVVINWGKLGQYGTYKAFKVTRDPDVAVDGAIELMSRKEQSPKGWKRHLQGSSTVVGPTDLSRDVLLYRATQDFDRV